MCTHHGGCAPAVKAKARRRLEEASDRLARQLLGIAEGAESEAVPLAAVKDALDRAGVQAKTAATVEVSVKPWETVLEGISKVVAGPRDPQQRALESSSRDDAVEGEVVIDEADVEVIGPRRPRPEPRAGDPRRYSDSDPTTNGQQLADNHERPRGGVTPPDDSASALRGRWAARRVPGERSRRAAGATRTDGQRDAEFAGRR